MRPKTAEESAMSARLRHMLNYVPKDQTIPVATQTDAPTASASPDTQTPSSTSESPVPEPYLQTNPPPSTPEDHTQPASQSDPAPKPRSIIERCVIAYNEARSEEYARTEDRFAAKDAGSMAYRNTMPPLRGAENIRDFIACVAQALLFGVIKDKDASKLLYAAQVAFSTEKQPSPKRAPKSAPEATASSSAKN